MGLGLRYQGVLSSVEDKVEINLSTIEDEITCRGRSVLDVRRKHRSEALLPAGGWGPRFALAHYFGEMFPRNRGSPAACLCRESGQGGKIRPTEGRRARGGCLRFAKYLVD